MNFWCAASCLFLLLFFTVTFTSVGGREQFLSVYLISFILVESFSWNMDFSTRFPLDQTLNRMDNRLWNWVCWGTRPVDARRSINHTRKHREQKLIRRVYHTGCYCFVLLYRGRSKTPESRQHSKLSLEWLVTKGGFKTTTNIFVENHA